jgi:hypothetical protein
MHSYQYQSLQFNDSIRILILHPSPNQSKPIVCTIQHIRLSDKTINYEALSYTWGDITQKEAIHFHDGSKDLLVGKTCHDALRNLRQTTTYRLLWIDAICINQKDPSERNHQVRMMDVVYNRASKVVVFLGEHTAGSRVLFEELAAADKLMTLKKKCDRPPPSLTVVDELEKLWLRPWFKRVWVIQEVCAKPGVIFMCGSSTSSYPAMSHLYCGYSHTKVTKFRWPYVLDWIETPRQDFATPQLSLWHRLHESRECLATDPRDRVIAMKSLVKSGQSKLDHLIEYTRSVEYCFIQVAKFLLPVLGLRMLTAIRHKHDRDMPSWIPDWSQNLPLHHFKPYEWSDSRYKDSFCSNIEQPYEVRTISCRGAENWLELRTIGYEYACIVESSQEFTFDSKEETETQMRRLYYCLVNLRSIFAVGEVNDDRKMLKHLGQNISKGKCIDSMRETEN